MDIESITETEILDALGENKLNQKQTNIDDLIQEKSEKKEFELKSDTIDDLALLFKALMNNKTLEISIKIKD